VRARAFLPYVDTHFSAPTYAIPGHFHVRMFLLRRRELLVVALGRGFPVELN
jgi:hypothetical protein